MSYKIYSVQSTELECMDYKVKVNGKMVELNKARVSAFPFNRRWPGHQRQINQTEIIQFLSMETDEPVTFEIVPSKPFENVDIRPRSLGIVPEIKDGTIIFTLEKPAYFTVEPYGRKRALHIFADAVSNFNVRTNSSDTIYFGKGVHDAGLIEMKSGQTLFIDEGAVVYASVYATDAENIRILGRGILDNSRNKEEILFEANEENNIEAVNNAVRRHTIQLEYCKNIEIDGITIRDSLVYNIRPVGCKNIDIKNIKIIGCWRYNSDGIDMHNCVNAHISNCFIRTFDDCICVKGFDCYYNGDVETAVRKAMYRNGKSYDIFKNVLVENCVLWNDWGKCLEIGAETKAKEICKITFKNCDIIHVTHVPLDVCNVDYAYVNNIRFENINIDYDKTLPRPALQKNDDDVYINDTENKYIPWMICVSVAYHSEYSKGSELRRGKNNNIYFENIHLFSDESPKIKCEGYDEDHRTENLIISGLKQNGVPITKLGEEDFKIGKYCYNIQLK